MPAWDLPGQFVFLKTPKTIKANFYLLCVLETKHYFHTINKRETTYIVHPKNYCYYYAVDVCFLYLFIYL